MRRETQGQALAVLWQMVNRLVSGSAPWQQPGGIENERQL
jgi:hypothetical protein